MESRVFPAIYNLLKQGEKVTKYIAASQVHCHPKVAQKILTHLHVTYEVRIYDWIHSRGSPIPVYCIYDGLSDARKIPTLTADRTKYQRKRRKNPEVREKEAATKRLKRQLANPPKLGIWGL